MKITTIIENVSNKEGLFAEHGLCFFVEVGEHKFLVDVGASELAYQNFCTLGFDSDEIEAIVLSHNHNDHVGGLQPFLDNNKQASFAVSSRWETSLYSKKPLVKARLISCCDVIKSNCSRAIEVADQLELLPNVFVCRVKNPLKCYGCKDKKLKMKKGNRLVPDDFAHEVYVAVIEEGGAKIISSCTHNGVVNVIEDAKKRFENVPICAFVGGLHFKGKSLDSLNCRKGFLVSTISYLNNSDLTQLFTAHCTGTKAFALIKKHCVLHTRYLSTGDVLQL